MFAHADDVSNLFVGKKINKNEAFYSEGTKGNATGNHCHIECGKGKFKDNGWYQNESGYWSINNRKKPQECLWIDDKINIINDYGYNFKKIEQNKISTEIVDKNNKTFIAPKTDLYGIYLKENQKVIIELTK